MTKHQLNEILKLSKEEKIDLVQTLWDDISADEESKEISLQHKKLLEETLERIEKGETQFSRWEDVKVKYGKKK